jgi:hypothetical protein
LQLFVPLNQIDDNKIINRLNNDIIICGIKVRNIKTVSDGGGDGLE